MAQQQIADTDYADDITDPEQLQANIDAADQKNITSAPNQFTQNNALIQAGAGQFGQAFARMTGDDQVGDPRVVQARKVSDAMKSIIQDANQNADPNEDPMDRQERVASAVAAGMANISPQIALKANMQAVALQQAKTQQALINEQTANVSSEVASRNVKTDEEKANANYVVFGTKKGKDGLPVYQSIGDPVSMYNPDGSKNPDFNTQLQKNIATAKAQGLDNPLFQTTDKFENSKQAVQMLRAQAQAAAADSKAASKSSGLTDAGVAQAAIDSIIAPTTVSRLSQGDKEAMINFKAAKGITPVDEAAAISQMKSLNSAAVAIGTRAGNITTLGYSMDGMGKQVLQTLDGVSRTRFPALNAGIILGKNAAGSGPEAAYSASIQSFVNEYTRVMANGMGISTDSARADATALLSKAMSPEAVKAVVKQLGEKETNVIKNASDQAVEAIAHPERYGAIMKIQNAAGIRMFQDDTVNGKPLSGSPTDTIISASNPPARPGQQAPQKASTGWGPAMKVQP